MKLEKFKNIDKKKRFIIIFTVCCVFLLAGVFLYTSFATFTEEKQFNVINGQVQDPGDLYFAVYIDGQITNTFPKKDDGYSFDASQSSCTNGATVSWDNESWSALINFSNYQAENMSRTKCTVHFKKSSYCDLNPDAATCTILSLADSSSELVYDGTTDNNLRYIGQNPNNYVSFNGELWRIIGVMNNIDNGSSIKETRLKIIKNEPHNKEMAWNTGNVNDWTTSSLQEELNTTYLNSIQSPYKEMISNAVWNLGGTVSTGSTATGFASHWYEYERGTAVYTGRPIEWTGSIGLMYPSDYGYATSGGSTTDRASCLATALFVWNNSSYSDCKNNDWLYNSSDYQWTLTPSSSSSNTVWIVNRYGEMIPISLNYTNIVSPVLYLSSNVKITGGTGTSSDPYQLSL